MRVLILGKQLSWLLNLVFVSALLTGCVVTEKGGPVTKPDKTKALEYTLQLARTYIRDRNWEAAKRHLKNALEMDSRNAEVYEALGMVFQNTGEIERAEEHYLKAIQLNGKLSRVRNNYGAYLYQQKRYQDAAKQLELVVADTLYERRAFAYMNLARCYVQLKQLDKAADAYKRSYLMNRRNVVVTLELAEVYYELKNYPESQRLYDAFRGQIKQQPARALWLGLRLADQFNNTDALSSYSLALKNLYPHSKEYLEYKRVYLNDR